MSPARSPHFKEKQNKTKLSTQPGVLAHTFNLSTFNQEAEAGGISEFKDSLVYVKEFQAS